MAICFGRVSSVLLGRTFLLPSPLQSFSSLKRFESRSSGVDVSKFAAKATDVPLPAAAMTSCRFGSFELHAEQRRLLEDGRPVDSASGHSTLLCWLSVQANW
jgi:hypothetical protein